MWRCVVLVEDPLLWPLAVSYKLPLAVLPKLAISFPLPKLLESLRYSCWKKQPSWLDISLSASLLIHSCWSGSFPVHALPLCFNNVLAYSSFISSDDIYHQIRIFVLTIKKIWEDLLKNKLLVESQIYWCQFRTDILHIQFLMQYRSDSFFIGIHNLSSH